MCIITADGSFLEGDTACKNDSKLLVDKSFKDMVLTPIKSENKILTAARDAIAANGNLKYGSRMELRPAISISGNLTNQSLCCGEIRGEERMNISPVGLEEVFQDYWIGEDGTYGIGDLFLTEDEWVERDIEQLIMQKTRNKL